LPEDKQQTASEAPHFVNKLDDVPKKKFVSQLAVHSAVQSGSGLERRSLVRWSRHVFMMTSHI